jgi:diguanylate cyclase (GGDEF)-like protein/PAS domain S-box-containing protein
MRVRGASDGGRTDAGDAAVKSAQESGARPDARKAPSTACTAAPNEPFLESDSQYRLLFENNPVPMWVFHRATLRFLAVNHAAIRQYGYSEAEFLERTIADIRPAETVPSLMMDLAQRRRGLQLREVWKHCRSDGTVFDVEIACHDIVFHDTEAMLVAAYDVTARERAQQAALRAEEKYRAIFENAVVGIFQHTPEGRPVNINQAFAQMHGYASPEELLAEVTNAAAQLFVEPQRMKELAMAAATQGIVRAAEVELYRKDRNRFWVMVNLRAVRDEAGNIMLFEGTAQDITNRKEAEAQVNFLAYHDALTGLPNRALFTDRLETALAAARRRNEKLAVLFLDLDRFKNINDSLGHSFGDQMLKLVAQRLKESVREQDTVARVGGDEFLIMLSGVDHAAEPELAAHRIMSAITRTFLVRGHMLSTTCSIGVSIFPHHGEDGETLIRNADAAMYCAKDDGSNRVCVFADRMNSAAVAQLTLENDLRTALDAREFFLLYQPQMEIATGRITGIEALLRWQHPVLGLVPPDRFIPVAENSGLILPIGEWVIGTACAQIRTWQNHSLPVPPVSVNVSALQFRQEGFCSSIRRALEESGLSSPSLELELTESVLLSSADVIRPVLEELKNMGVALAIDDFGTGYSSLSYLKQFRFGKLKIDRSFIRDLVADNDDAAITTAIIRMAKSLNLKVLAEGVETEAQMSFLRERGCDEIQGYYFSRPLAAGDLAALLASAPAGRKVTQADLI